VARSAVRSLEEVAIENAAEGCVRETFGALVGMWQATFAADARVRRAMKGVSRDECRHATLSWEIAQWIEHRLNAHARQRLETARREAIHHLEVELWYEPEMDVVREAGIPSAQAAHRLFEHARAALWLA